MVAQAAYIVCLMSLSHRSAILSFQHPVQKEFAAIRMVKKVKILNINNNIQV
jgi:hypothetical protein